MDRFVPLYRRQWPKSCPRKRNVRWQGGCLGDFTDSWGKKEAEVTGERERYTQLHVEFQRTARREKAFLNEQCKEIIEESNIIRKTRNLFKKIGDIKGTFHARMGIKKDRNGKDLTEAEEIKKQWQEYTEELDKKVLMNQITTMMWSLT